MKLKFTDPLRPQDLFLIADRTDSDDPLVKEGETFEVSAVRGRELLGSYHPRLQLAESKPPVVVTEKKEEPAKTGDGAGESDAKPDDTKA